MFNSYDYSNHTIKVNACNGGIYKTYKESWFEKFGLNSNKACNLFYRDSNIAVIQMVLCEDDYVIAELILKKDFEKYFKEVTKDE